MSFDIAQPVYSLRGRTLETSDSYSLIWASAREIIY